MNLDPDNVLADPEARDVLVSVLNAMDGRIDTALRVASIKEVAMGLILNPGGSDKQCAYIGCLIGLLIKLSDEAQHEAAAIIDTFRAEVKDAHHKG